MTCVFTTEGCHQLAAATRLCRDREGCTSIESPLGSVERV